MFCPACGARVSTNDTFCASCGAAIGLNAAQPVERVRPGLITVIAIFDFLGAVTLLLIGGGLTGTGMFGDTTDGGIIAVMGIVFAIFGVLYGVAGVGLWKLKPYGRTTQMVLAVFGLLGIPIGTLISIAILIYLSNPGIKALFAGRPIEELSAADAAALRKVSTGMSVPALVGIVLAVLVVGVMAMGIVAAIAVPGLMRARIGGNEASAIGRIRAVISGEIAYFGANGAYATLDCLAAPSNCVPGYTGAPFILPDLQQSEHSGYRFTFHPDAGIARQGRLDAFAIIAVPIQPGTTGGRAFCGDFTGQVCEVERGRTPEIVNGMCSACVPLR